MKIYPELNKAIRQGARITRRSTEKQNDAGAVLGICLALAAVIFLTVIIGKGV